MLSILVMISLSLFLLGQVLKGKISFSDLLDITSQLRHILHPAVDKIYAGDILATIEIMNVVTQKTNSTMENTTKKELGQFLEVRNLSFIADRVHWPIKWPYYVDR